MGWSMGRLLGICCNRFILKPHCFDTIEVDCLYSHHMPWAAGMGMGDSGKGAATFCHSDWWKPYRLQTTASIFPQDKKEDGCSHTLTPEVSACPESRPSGIPVLRSIFLEIFSVWCLELPGDSHPWGVIQVWTLSDVGHAHPKSLFQVPSISWWMAGALWIFLSPFPLFLWEPN